MVSVSPEILRPEEDPVIKDSITEPVLLSDLNSIVPGADKNIIS
jgi:hypothetical protein